MSGAGAPVDLLVIDAVAARHATYRDQLGPLVRQVVTVSPGDSARQRLRSGGFGAVVVHLDGAAHDTAAADLALITPSGAASGPPIIVISAEMPDLYLAADAPPGAIVYVPSAFAAELLPEKISCVLEIARLRDELSRRDQRIDVLAHQVNQMMAAIAEEKRVSDALRERMGEQIHRSKNLLTILQSVARRTMNDGREIAETREALMGRLRALARAYQLVTATDGSGTDIAEIVDAELSDILHRVTASGPPARLAGSVVQTFALALHELAVNAVTHGALRSPEGAVAVGWTFFEQGPDRYLEVAWTERGGAPPTAPPRYGFGLTLVSSFGGAGASTPNIVFEAEGLTCRMRLPQDVVLAG